MKLFTARSLVVAPGVVHPGGGILCDDRVRRVARSAAEVERIARTEGVAVEDLGEGVLAPGLVDAHAHLELSDLDAGPDRSFRAWIDGLMRALSESSFEGRVAAAARAADRLLATGTTLVGDIDSTGAGRAGLLAHALRACSYRELLDALEPERTAQVLRAAEEPLELRNGMTAGLSPHSPYTASARLLAGVGRLVRSRRLAVALHWAETPEEIEWTLHGRGALQGLVQRSPGCPGLDLIEAGGLLAPRTSLVHGNHPAPGEIERIAAAGATCVHCPGSHAYFGRAPFPAQAYLDAGVPIALGTDSAASNDDLDMRREMSLLRAAHPELDPELVWRMATVSGARALGAEEEPGSLHAGSLHVGAQADFCVYALSPTGVKGCFDALTAAVPPVLGTWIGGDPIALDAR